MKGTMAALLAALLAFGTAAVAAERAAGGTAPMVVAQAKASEPIDINTAKAEALMTLDGIGEARAKAIIKARPYKRKDELVQKGIIPQSVYDKNKDKIIAKQ